MLPSMQCLKWRRVHSSKSESFLGHPVKRPETSICQGKFGVRTADLTVGLIGVIATSVLARANHVNWADVPIVTEKLHVTSRHKDVRLQQRDSCSCGGLAISLIGTIRTDRDGVTALVSWQAAGAVGTAECRGWTPMRCPWWKVK